MSGRSLSICAALIVVIGLLVAGPGSSVTPAAQASGTGSVTGTVTVPAGYDVRAVTIFVRSVAAFDGYGNADAWVGPEGHFSVSGLSPGDYYVGFGTYWSDMQPCSSNRDRWWSGPGQANGTCNATVSGGTAVSVTDGATTDLGTTPLLTSMPIHRYAGRLLAPPAHTPAGLQVEVWLGGDGAWPMPPGGWARLASVPVQTLGSDGRFAFDLTSPMGSNQLALRVVDPASNGYAFSVARGGLTSTTPGAGGADFGAGAVGLLNLPLDADAAYGDLQVRLPIGYVSGGVTLSGAPEWGRTLTAHSDVVWSDPLVGTDFQWYRNGVALDDAVGSTYVLDGSDDGWEAQFSVRATPTGPWAYVGSPIESSVITIENTTPLNVALPVIDDSAVFGQPLGAGSGSWRPTSPEYTFAYQWFRGTAAIKGADASTYTPGVADLGQRLSVEVTAARPPDCPLCSTWFTGPGTAHSLSTLAVSAAAMPLSWIKTWPVEVGKLRVGKRVRVTRPVFSAPGAAQHLVVRYRWYAAGKPIKGATRPALKVRKSMRQQRIKVVATVAAPGYVDRVRTLSFGRVR